MYLECSVCTCDSVPHSPSSGSENKRRLPPIGSEAKAKFLESAQFNGIIKRSGLVPDQAGLTSDGMPIVRGSHGTVTLTTRRSSVEGVKSHSHSGAPRVEAIVNGHLASTTFEIPPIV